MLVLKQFFTFLKVCCSIPGNLAVQSNDNLEKRMFGRVFLIAVPIFFLGNELQFQKIEILIQAANLKRECCDNLPNGKCQNDN